MMRKIRLHPDALRVETFQTHAVPGDPGTVRAHDASGQSCTYACTVRDPTCNGPACNTVPVVTCLC